MITKRLPDWLKKKRIYYDEVNKTQQILKTLNINTICESAKCPNITECFKKSTATFLILGNICTRNCKFCAVHKGIPKPIDIFEIQNIILAIDKLNLKYVVITSVTRDDLQDFGASQFIKVIEEIRNYKPNITIEILTPDFMGEEAIIANIVKAKPNIFSHNIETVPRLYSKIRDKADYVRSLNVLKTVKKIDSSIYTKSGIMLGLGENLNEVIDVFNDLRKNKCNILTIGQYLQPSSKQIEVQEYINPEIFEDLRIEAVKLGFYKVVSGPFVRSSYNASLEN